ncbi:DUF4439 domain-containing protein [Aeromicrobium sp. CF4.19]|uniref:DUF4439 domain-containing protein n=1 Tax=Aeromicrobium sp. CF4.19 TaxID=3373082 RepID=UPI003EE56DC1
MSREEQDAALVDTLQARLALEHEAVWLLGTVGGRVEPLRERAEAAFAEHRTARDRLLRTIDRLSAAPVGARAAYGTPPADRTEAVRAVADLELRIAAASLAGLREATTRGRRSALGTLRTASLAAMDWGAEPQAFPGLD